MATRRTGTVAMAEKPLTAAQGGPPSSAVFRSDTTPAVPAEVIYKLLFFTMAMVVVPIGGYFASVNVVFRGNSTYAGAFAAVLANVVLVGYVIVAMKEDQSDRLEAEAARRKGGEGKKVQ